MSKIAFTVLLNRPESILSPHFGKAKWIMIRGDAGDVAFEQNMSLNGRAVVDILRRSGCTDVVSAEIGEGAYHHLQQAGIRAWAGQANVPAPRLAEMAIRGQLQPLKPKPHAPEGCCSHSAVQAKAGGCCCG